MSLVVCPNSNCPQINRQPSLPKEIPLALSFGLPCQSAKENVHHFGVMLKPEVQATLHELDL